PSTAYLTGNRRCAREVELFGRRPVVPRHGTARPGETMIVPVLWTPPAVALPAEIARAGVFVPSQLSGDHRAGYRAAGLLGLLRSGKEQVFQAIVWRLAQHVDALWRDHRVEPL
ncbi:hypothetical protein ACSNN8_20480, partial [Actinoplanes sp. URMC 104]